MLALIHPKPGQVSCRADVLYRARQSEPLAKSVLLRYGETALRVGLSNCRLAAQSMQNRRIIPGVSVRVRMVDRLGALERGSHSCDRPVDIAENPKHPRHEGQHGHSGILSGCPSSHPVGFLTYTKYLNSAFDRLAGLDDASPEKENHRPSA